MNFAERDEGDYRIYLGAIEAQRGEGYQAAVVIHRVRGVDGAPQETYRDDSLCAGYAWPTPDAALSFALRKARSAIQTKPSKSVSSLSGAAHAAAVSGRSVGRRSPAPVPRDAMAQLAAGL